MTENLRSFPSKVTFWILMHFESRVTELRLLAIVSKTNVTDPLKDF